MGSKVRCGTAVQRALSTQRPKATSTAAFLVPQPAGTDGDADSDGTEGTGSEQNEDGDAGTDGDAPTAMQMAMLQIKMKMAMLIDLMDSSTLPVMHQVVTYGTLQ